jgi:hypothetical protein
LIVGLVAVTNSGWNTTFTGSSAALSSRRWRRCLSVGSLASSIKSCVTIRGWRCVRQACIARFSRTCASSGSSSEYVGSRPVAADWNSRWPICSWIMEHVLRSSLNIDWFRSTSTFTCFTAALVMMNATTVGASGTGCCFSRRFSRCSASRNRSIPLFRYS